MSKLIGTNPNQVPSNADLGSAAFMDKKEFLLSKGSSLSEINATIPQSATAIFIYDTTKDSDGGAWRKRCQNTSWYNEALNTTTRGSRREFPSVAVMVAQPGKLTIYDGDYASMPMWMVFITNSYGPLSSAAVSSIHALNGVLFTGSNDGTGSSALGEIHFIRDACRLHQDSAINQTKDSWANAVAGRNDGAVDSWANEKGILVNAAVSSRYVNDIDMAILEGAPLDEVSLLPIPSIAVATISGVAIVRHNGAVQTQTLGAVGSTGDSTGRLFSIAFTAEGEVLVGQEHRMANFGARVWRLEAKKAETAVKYGWATVPYIAGTAFGAGSQSIRDICMDKKSSRIFLRTVSPSGEEIPGVSIIQHNSFYSNSSLVCDIRDDYNTGWLPGNTAVATLADTAQGTVVSNELVTNGTFDSNVANWEISSGSAVWDAGRMLLTSSSGGGERAWQSISTVVGKTYTVCAYADANGNGATPLLYINHSLKVQPPQNYVGWMSHTFKATSTTTTIGVGWNAAVSGYYDNISMRVAEVDHSINHGGLQVIGTVNKLPVAPGADLVAYSGLNGTSYLQAPSTSIPNVGTGDFTLQGWVWHDGTSADVRFGPISLDESTNTGLVLYINNARSFYLVHRQAGGTWLEYTAQVVSAFNFSQWQHVAIVRYGNIQYTYLNGKLVGTASQSFNPNDATGFAIFSNGPGHKHALIRYSLSATNAEDIAKIYEDEKVLFQENAKATLYGSSNVVTAVAYDESTELLHVGTSEGRSVFQGLRRIDNTTDAVGVAISASNGLVVEE